MTWLHLLLLAVAVYATWQLVVVNRPHHHADIDELVEAERRAGR